MLSSFAIILRDPLLRLVTLSLFLTGVAISSVMPYASLIAVERLGLSDTAYSIVLMTASSVMVVVSVVAGIVTDQRANRRQMLVVSFLVATAGYSLVFFTRSPVAFIIAHTTLLPLGFSVFSQLFALARMAGKARGGRHADEIFAITRASFSLAFVITPPLWSLALASGVAKEGLCGLELVEVSPPYDTSDITALMGTRVIVDVLGAMVSHGTLGKHKAMIDKPVQFPHGAFEGKRWSNPHPHKVGG